MKVLIAGLPKSGTTILTYRVAEALDDVHIDFEPQGPPAADLGAGHDHLITKKLVGAHTATLAEYRDYDRRIWLHRDPRDFLVSQSLYRWHREEPPTELDRVWFERVIEKLRAKERDPGSVSFGELEPANYFETFDAVAELAGREIGAGWLRFGYEDMVAGRYDELNRYLGFDVVPEAEVATGLERVARRGTAGDWRDWFTEADVAFYSAGGLARYMTAFGYDQGDWALNDPQTIDPAHGSDYMTALFDDHRAGSPGPSVDERSRRQRFWSRLGRVH